MKNKTEKIESQDVHILATIRCAHCGESYQIAFGADAPTFCEEALADCLADEGWTVKPEWYEETGNFHPREVSCDRCADARQTSMVATNG